MMRRRQFLTSTAALALSAALPATWWEDGELGWIESFRWVEPNVIDWAEKRRLANRSFTSLAELNRRWTGLTESHTGPLDLDTLYE